MEPTAFRRRARLSTVALVLAVLTLGACKKASESSYTDGVAAEAPAAEGRQVAGDFYSVAATDTAGSGASSSATTAPDAPAMLIRTGTMRIRVPDLDDAHRAATQAAERLGGYVGNESATNASYGSSATLTLRVPAARYTTLADTLADLGTVEERTTEVDDVTRAYADLDARTKTRRATEERFRELLARANTVEEVMAVERQLGEIRADIESAEAQLRTMRDQAALSTLTVTFITENTTVGPTFASRFVDAIRDGGAMLVGMVLGIVRLWGLWLLVALAWLAWSKALRPRWRLRRNTPPLAEPPSDTDQPS